ncbi:SRPBCC domain-containing protein [Streptomyces huiliensis]|uniref:SRPBCC domain-containing protein n=1 Tax=Streptomyces huiliensis TaxID=2876027 RepID=UPI001CBF1D08|nr:SRPBCC domain-containing protein [Streptomyces huiliensis]MBZ4321149.1 SRPBCC domain-containing protein [Streptomyces huiliensis]
MEMPSPYGASETHGDVHTLCYELSLPYPRERVWAAVATPEGLPTWLAAAEPFERREGGAITLRWLNTDLEGNATVAPGRVTAWEPESLAEYTVEIHGRIRFELEKAPVSVGGTLLHFTNEMPGTDDQRLDCLAGWHHHFEYLMQSLAGHPADWAAWRLDRWRELRGEYEKGKRELP